MTDIEKLAELLDEAEEWADHRCDTLECEKCPADKMKGNCVGGLMAQRLIEKGVTVQEWIPVTERLPEFVPNNSRKYLTLWAGAIDSKPYCELLWFSGKGWYRYDSEWGDVWYKNVTHWMPLPELPKEVSKHE